MRRLLAFSVLILIALLIPRLGSAQITVDLKLDRTLYLADEPITGELIIVNRAGQDLIFGDSGGLSWLDFTVTDGGGNQHRHLQD